MSELKSSAEVLNRFMSAAQSVTDDTEWEPLHDWKTLTDNQIIRAEGAGNTIIAAVYSVNFDSVSIIPEGVCEVVSLRPHIWSLFIEKPKVQLPDAPGHYVDKYDGWVYLAADGTWTDSSEYDLDAYVIASRAPFTLLRPVAEVAAEVLAEVRGIFGPGALLLAEVDAIASKFGVTS